MGVITINVEDSVRWVEIVVWSIIGCDVLHSHRPLPSRPIRPRTIVDTELIHVRVAIELTSDHMGEPEYGHRYNYCHHLGHEL